MLRNIISAVLLFFAPLLSLAQGTNTDPVVGVGKIYADGHGVKGWPVTTTATILSDPRLTVSLPGWRVTSFDFSIKPVQNDYMWPYIG